MRRQIIGYSCTALLGLSGSAAFGYGATGAVTFNWGGNSGGIGDPASIFGATSDTTADIAWSSEIFSATSFGYANALSSTANSTYFTSLSGYNARRYYNPDFASVADCTAGVGLPSDATTIVRRKYGCRFATTGNPNLFYASPLANQAAALTGAAASGTITVTDTTLTGTLSILSTTDEPAGATTTFSTSGARLSNSAGNGLDGYNYRTGENTPWGNAWQGITTAGTLEVNLTGTFTSIAWNITGGTVKFTDPGFACQQGGFGTVGADNGGTLCTRTTFGGGQQYNGAHLSWGWDLDGAATGTTAITGIDVRDATGTTTLSTLSGVLASLTVSGGNLSTTSGEFRRAHSGDTGGVCTDHIRWDGTKISCGSLTTGLLAISGTVVEEVVPIPAAAWLLASALGALGWIRHRAAGPGATTPSP